MRHTVFTVALLVSSARAQEAKVSEPKQPIPAMPESVAPAVPDAAPRVRTASGVVRGATEGDDSIFKGNP